MAPFWKVLAPCWKVKNYIFGDSLIYSTLKALFQPTRRRNQPLSSLEESAPLLVGGISPSPRWRNQPLSSLEESAPLLVGKFSAPPLNTPIIFHSEIYFT